MIRVIALELSIRGPTPKLRRGVAVYRVQLMEKG